MSVLCRPVSGGHPLVHPAAARSLSEPAELQHYNLLETTCYRPRSPTPANDSPPAAGRHLRDDAIYYLIKCNISFESVDELISISGFKLANKT